MSLEKIVKETFENFEPEVNSSVWQNLEQNLNKVSYPSDPSHAPSAGKIIVKGITGHGNVWLWVGGIVASSAIITAVLVSRPEKKNTDIKTATEQQATKKADIYIPDDNAAGKNAVLTTAHQASGKTTSQNKKEVSTDENIIQSSQKIDPPVTPSVHTNTNGSTQAGHVQEKQAAAAPDNEKVSAAETVNQPKPEASVAAPVVIMNTQMGFAPLKIIALLNGQDIKGSWDFGDGYSVPSVNTASHSYDKPGSYNLTCRTGETEIQKTIEVIGSVSTAFTPNNDGVNDEFYVESDQLNELSVKIVDRTGRQVFEITQPGERWNGTNQQGSPLPSGTYFYNIFARSINGQAISQKGTISIFK